MSGDKKIGKVPQREHTLAILQFNEHVWGQKDRQGAPTRAYTQNFAINEHVCGQKVGKVPQRERTLRLPNTIEILCSLPVKNYYLRPARRPLPKHFVSH